MGEVFRYFSTGNFYKGKIKPSRFERKYADIGESNTLEKRDYTINDKYDLKAPIHTRHDVKNLQSGFLKQNAKLESKDSIYSEFHHIDTTRENLSNKLKYKPLNTLELDIYRRKKFNKEADKWNCNVNASKKVLENPYNVNQSKVLEKNTHYFFKSNHDINVDLYPPPPIRNSRLLSEDLPDYLLSTTKNYDPSKYTIEQQIIEKTKQKNVPKTDIFGSSPHPIPPKPPKLYDQKMFDAEGMKIKSFSSFMWKENVANQRYEYSQAIKIAEPVKPVIKHVEEKRSTSELPIKIGGEYHSIKRKNNFQIKIMARHNDRPEPEYKPSESKYFQLLHFQKTVVNYLIRLGFQVHFYQMQSLFAYLTHFCHAFLVQNLLDHLFFQQEVF